MELHRYLLRDENEGECFGRHSWKNGQDFDWLFGDSRIGIIKTPYTEDDTGRFIDDFLTTDDRLLVIPHNKSPQIARQYAPERYPALKNINMGHDKYMRKLASIIQSQDATHVFLSSKYEDGSHPDILTFSRQAPTEELYIKGRVMPVSIVAEIYRPSINMAQRVNLTKGIKL